MKNSFKLTIGMCLLALGMVACDKVLPAGPEDNELLDGPIEGLTIEQQNLFLAGDEAFGEIYTIEKGLGPTFVATSCSSCHTGDGKGHPNRALVRFGQSDGTGNQYLHLGGPQLQHRSIPGYAPEVLPEGAPKAKLLAPATVGLGLLDAVTDASLLAMSDPEDENNDGISGVVAWTELPDYVTLRPGAIENGGKYISRFGKKAAAYNILHQVSKALNQDIGITSVYEPIDPYSGLEIDPEIATLKIHHLVSYLQTVKPPTQRDEDSPAVIAGEELFNTIGCANCHMPSLTTGFSPIEALNEKTFHPYTDLLLHDMGPGFDDGYTEGAAERTEWRTPPLWGLGLVADAQGGDVFLLHDGRAQSIEEAIQYHGGEAENANSAFSSLDSEQKEQLMKFLESL